MDTADEDIVTVPTSEEEGGHYLAIDESEQRVKKVADIGGSSRDFSTGGALRKTSLLISKTSPHNAISTPTALAMMRTQPTQVI
mmetsp:Transcript_31074/g.61524  ORF Transcript_31074/g.61524 Transcript_31074/m.61524 type:complete len:84 (-) Transcript_31074:195-446(-)